MSCHGGFSLDENKRRTWYNPEAILADVGLRKDMVFVDIGCGDGFFSLLAAEVVGEKGKVYSVDADAGAIQRLKQKAEQRHLTNVSAVVGTAEDTVLCQGCADVVFFSMALHDFSDPAKVLQNAHTMLKASGRVVDLDWKKKQMPFGPPEHIRFSEETAANLMRQADLDVEAAKEVGPHHYVVVAKHVG
jgi:ubiquinone/menaquinone biosynthesis C-methylase UbiE